VIGRTKAKEKCGKLTEASLVSALEAAQCVASVLVCGRDLVSTAKRLVTDRFDLKVREAKDWDPQRWELF
jgi:hypothetical protein